MLDTNIVIYFLEGRLASPLPSDRLRISVISEIELPSYKQLSQSSESAVREFLSTVEVLGLDHAIKEAAIALRREHGLTIPDAIIAATAVVSDAELLTNDTKLANLTSLRCRPLALRNP